MRKLKLDVEELTVESFAPERPHLADRGTVHAHDHTRGHNTCYFSCQVGCTADVSCYQICATTTTGLA
jgi:adenine C2-methylase RlmN of 23S rRNA A2503 and tRNA A37